MKPSEFLERRVAHCCQREPLPFPDYMHIELTSACNLRCVMCNHDQMRRPRRHMDFDLFRAIVDQLPPGAVFAVGLYYFGEPLLYPHLGEAIRYLRGRRPEIRTYLRTNGQGLTDEVARTVLESGLHSLQFSIEGGSAEVYERVMVGGRFATLRANIEHYLKLKRELGVEQSNAILSLLMPQTRLDRERVAAEWGTRMPVKFAPARAKYAVLAPGTATRRTRPCFDLYYHLTVLSDGLVTFCCCDGDGRTSLGTCADTAIGDLWRGATANDMRSRHRAGAFDGVCAECAWIGLRADIEPSPGLDAVARRAAGET